MARLRVKRILSLIAPDSSAVTSAQEEAAKQCRYTLDDEGVVVTQGEMQLSIAVRYSGRVLARRKPPSKWNVSVGGY